ncbi:hypothetical protein MON38_01865 [Hymenobacter sp. DH14]|uniref:YcxB-like protein domain-containing protein n=1 Tax=Hymenobacter cyanobacteriorum TaxID=2926463 RepID=A0A9X1VCM7_9BACT|nr:hypothetical protein [Hymenobacter cyanobacteriorum]MCI1186148.1 hypothetical protein [Hymenobacter cyanobacteriorum]
MQQVVIAPTLLSYTEYKKLMFADLRVRHLPRLIGFAFLSLAMLIIVGVALYDEGLTAKNLQDLALPMLFPAGLVSIWIATWLSWRKQYYQSDALRNGVTYYLNDQEIVRKGLSRESILWSNIDRTAKQAGQWILLRQATTSLNGICFLNTAAVLSPATREELLALLKRKRIKPI